MIVKDGAWYGWPKCYFDPTQNKLVLAPEYGGDGGKKTGDCDKAEPPLVVFPAHWAPNDLKLYKGTQFPKPYVGGAFIAFHGSWNRAPGPQEGYNIVFQPLADGKPSGQYVIFADGFAGKYKEPGRAAHRPSGVAVGTDGALFISDDKAGRIWRVTFNGDPSVTNIEAAPSPAVEATTSPEVLPPEGIHPRRRHRGGRFTGSAGSDKRARSPLGKKIFHGDIAGATCAGCHGADGIGTPVGPDPQQRNLALGRWQPSGHNRNDQKWRASNQSSTPVPCRRWAASSFLTKILRQSRLTCGPWATRARQSSLPSSDPLWAESFQVPRFE